MANWKFKPYTEDDTRENPTQSQFFTTDEVQNMANGLIREGIQNALDEQDDRTSPIRIRIKLSGNLFSISPEDYKEYFQDLIEHLAAKESDIREIPDFEKERMEFLTFEDFNTNGLRGNPNESKDIEIEDLTIPHNFYYFWKNIGITGKPEDKLGRWGIGKTVFPASSRVNTFWGLTIQKGSNDVLLLGQSILKKHNIESDPKDWGYKPYGYYGQYSSDSYFPKPITNEIEIEKFKKLFGITRSNEPGLSIVIPFCKAEINFDHLLLAIINQYFFPVIKGNLIVQLQIENKLIEISKNNLRQIICDFSEVHIDDNNTFDKNALLALIDFALWAINLAGDEYIQLSAQPANNQPRWVEKLWAGINIEELRMKYGQDRRIAFRIPVKYQKEGTQNPKICWFNAYLEKDESLKKPEDHFIRENITIIGVKSLNSPNTRGMVVIEDSDLANLLGDSENPAHTQWQKDSQNFTHKYKDGEKCIQFIIKSLSTIYSKLQTPAIGLNFEILKNIFFIQNIVQDNTPTHPDDDSEKDIKTQKPKIPRIETNPSRVRVQKIQGGVRVYPDNIFEDDLPTIQLSLAYMTTRGRPLKKYQEYDFDVNKDPIRVVSDNCNILKKESNKIQFEAVTRDFEMTITGFDLNRDLFIKIDTEYSENDKEI